MARGLIIFSMQVSQPTNLHNYSLFLRIKKILFCSPKTRCVKKCPVNLNSVLNIQTVSSPFPVAVFLIVKDWTCEKCHVRSAQLLCEQTPTITSIFQYIMFCGIVRHENILGNKFSHFQIKLYFLVGTSNEYSFRLTTFAPLIYGDRSWLPRRVRGSMERWCCVPPGTKICLFRTVICKMQLENIHKIRTLQRENWGKCKLFLNFSHRQFISPFSGRGEGTRMRGFCHSFHGACRIFG